MTNRWAIKRCATYRLDSTHFESHRKRVTVQSFSKMTDNISLFNTFKIEFPFFIYPLTMGQKSCLNLYQPQINACIWQAKVDNFPRSEYLLNHFSFLPEDQTYFLIVLNNYHLQIFFLILLLTEEHRSTQKINLVWLSTDKQRIWEINLVGVQTK